jgi:hypothetical protein
MFELSILPLQELQHASFLDKILGPGVDTIASFSLSDISPWELSTL